MNSADFIRLLDTFPRIPMAHYPSALEPLPRLSQELNCPIYIKRDDDIGPGMGGNKTRKLEYLLPLINEQSFRKVVTFGGLQSNHARITAAVARKAGLEPHLFYFERRPSRLTGNLLICQLLGAKMHFIPIGGSSGGLSLETTIRLVRWLAFFLVGRNYFIPVGGHCWQGCLGYVRAAAEIHQQLQGLGLTKARIVLAAGSGGTLAGLMAGLQLMESPYQPLGIDVGKLWKGFPASIAALAGQICKAVGSPLTFNPQGVPLIEGAYVGPQYGSPSLEGTNALQLLARLEGILLDPVYTAKAFAGMLDLIQTGQIGKNEAVIFLHTGGLPALFAFQRETYIES